MISVSAASIFARMKEFDSSLVFLRKTIIDTLESFPLSDTETPRSVAVHGQAAPSSHAGQSCLSGQNFKNARIPSENASSNVVTLSSHIVRRFSSHTKRRWSSLAFLWTVFCADFHSFVGTGSITHCTISE